MSKAFLTIDDISSGVTRGFVDYLNSKNITPIMFAVGENLERYFEEAVYAIKNGAIVGNHSHTHKHFSQLSLESCLDEIRNCEVILNKVYEEAGVQREYKIFRFPYGDKGGENKEKIQDFLRENDFCRIDDSEIYFDWYKESNLNTDIDFFWTFDFCEYQFSWGNGYDFEAVKKRIHDANPKNGGSLLEEGSMHIVLIHDTPETYELMPDYYKIILDYTMECGVEFIKPRIQLAKKEN